MSPQEIKKHAMDLLQKKDFAAAGVACREAEGQCSAADLALMRGVLCAAEGKKEQALDLLSHAFEQAPAQSDIAYHYGAVLHDAGQNDAAFRLWFHAIKLDPACLPAWQDSGAALAAEGATAEVLAFFKTALKYHPTDRRLLFSYGILCCDGNDWDEAARAFDVLTQVYPRDADVWINAGKTYKTIGALGKAEFCYQQALAVGEAAQQALTLFNYSHLLLSQSRWREGFLANEARLSLPGALRPPWGLPPWRVDLSEGCSILLWNDQGLGDAMMFVRFAAQLKAKGFRLSALVQEPLKRLFSAVAAFDAVYVRTDEPQEFDAALPLGSLPFVLKKEQETSWHGAYLSAPSDLQLTPPIPEENTTRLKIGIVWAGNPAHVNDKNRSMPPETFAPLFEVPGIDWYSLQKGSIIKGHAFVRELGSGLADLAETAVVIARLDLVICVDTAVAHLAGAMGKPVWILLPALGKDWRWGLSGEESVWYPSARLFRQAQAGVWNDVILCVRERLIRVLGQSESL